MRWSVAQAKQKLSELLRAAAREPQAIHNRGRLVAVVLDAATFEQFDEWRARQQRDSVGAAFGELRRLCAEEAYSLVEPERQDRENEFVDNAKIPV